LQKNFRSRIETGMRPRTVELKAPDYARRSSPALPGGASVDRNSFRSPAIAIAPQCSHTGRRGRVGVLKFEMGDGAQGLPENLASARLHAGETTALPGGASVDRNSFRSPAIAVAPQCSYTGRRGRAGVLMRFCPPCEAARGRDARAPRRRQRRPKFISVARDCDRPAMLPHRAKGEGGRPDG